MDAVKALDLWIVLKITVTEILDPKLFIEGKNKKLWMLLKDTELWIMLKIAVTEYYSNRKLFSRGNNEFEKEERELENPDRLTF